MAEGANSVADPDDVLTPSFENPPTDDIFNIQKAEGSVFIDGKTSYSGADIKIVVHVYDNGKAAEDRLKFLTSSINTTEQRLKDVASRKKVLEERIAEDVISSVDITKLYTLNIEEIRLENAIVATQDELDRLSKSKPLFSTKVMAEVQTLSVSSHREKFPVRAFGTTYAKSYCRGSRTIAGSMICTVFDRDVFNEFLEIHASDFDVEKLGSTAILDQIPPVDITVAFANELGQLSRMGIYGVEFVNQGQTMSIEDLLLENVVQYVARDFDPMRLVGKRNIDESHQLTQQIIPVRGSELLRDQKYEEYKDLISPYSRHKNRNTPFI